MDAPEEAQELRKQSTINDLGVPPFLWFGVHLGAVYLIVHFCTPWLAGWVRWKVLPFLQQPTTSSSGTEFLFSHIFALSFFPALAAGMITSKWKHRSAEWVWVVPTSILFYKLLAFPSVASVLGQNESWPAFHHYFGGGFLLPQTNNWKDFWTVVGSNGAARLFDQLNFTAPFYAGIAYSMATCTAIRTDLTRKLSNALKDWEERRFGATHQNE
jgi:hypothetical protein